MVWESKETKYLADQTNIFKNGREFSRTLEYTPGEHNSEVNLKFIKETAQIIVVPYKLEILTNPIEKAYEDAIVHVLTAGIQDDSKIQFIGLSWRPKKSDFKDFEQYFFEEDQPAGYLSTFYSGPSWPSTKPRIIDTELRPYFDELMEFRLGASESIQNCVKLLA